MSEDRLPRPTCSYSMVRRMARMVIHVFLKKVEYLRPENVPKSGPLIVIANHNNQFVDAMMMMKSFRDRPVRFITAEKSMHRPVIGTAAKLAGAVPVIRPQDRAVKGTGRLVDFDPAALELIGEGTKFTDECTVGFAITIRGIGNLKIVEIVSDTVLKMNDGQPWIDDFLKAKRSGEESFAYKVTPKINQNEVYQAVYDALAVNSTISIFPEGGSHDQTHILDLKPGVAVMAVGAAARGAPVQILPVGLNYFQGHQFRSNVVVDFGIPFSVKPEVVDMYNSGEGEENTANRRAAYVETMKDVKAALESVTINAPNYEILTTLRTARRLYQGSIDLSLGDYMKLYRRFVNSYEKWKDAPAYQKLAADINSYLKYAATLGFNDKQVRDLPPENTCLTWLNTIFTIVISQLFVIILMIVFAPAYILNAPFYCKVETTMRREIKKANAGSLVKNKALDVAMSQRVIQTCKYFPPQLIVYVVVSAVLFVVLWNMEGDTGQWYDFLIDNVEWLFPLAFFFLFPLYTYGAVLAWEMSNRRLRQLPSQIYILREIIKDKFRCCSCRSSSDKKRASLSQTSNLRLRRRHLVMKTQRTVFELTKSDPEWQEDPIISKDELNEMLQKETEIVLEYLKRNESLSVEAMQAAVVENDLV